MKNIESVKYLRNWEFKGFEIRIVEKSYHLFPKHIHDGIYTLSLVESGGSFCLGKNNPHSYIKKDHMALINPGQVHSCVPPKDRFVSYMTFSIDEQYMRKIAADLFGKYNYLPEFPNPVMDNRMISRLFKNLAYFFIINEDHFALEVNLASSLGHLLSEYGYHKKKDSSVKKNNPAVRKSIEFLMDHLEDNISLDELARASGTSKFHFLRLFKEATGLPPHQFRTQKRIEFSKRLIKKGTPLSQVALLSGFSDQSHFTNRFRLLTGSSPKQYADNR